jgi:hypothetical protein
MISETRPQFSDEIIRRFLLGNLNSAEQSVFENSLFADGELEERVRLAELELSDDFVAERLNSADRDLFRQRFLLTADRETSLEVSKALQQNFAPAGVSASRSFGQQIAGLFDIRQHAWKYAFASLILVLLLLATALLVRKERSRVAGVSPRPRSAAPRSSATSTPLRTNHSTNAPAPAHSETSPALPLHEGLPTSVVLVSGTALESAPVISTSGDVITVQLELPEPFASAYDVNVMTISGESLFSANALPRGANEMLGFDIPTNVLKPGDFQVALTRIDGESKQSAGIYYFRIR